MFPLLLNSTLSLIFHYIAQAYLYKKIEKSFFNEYIMAVDTKNYYLDIKKIRQI